MIGARDIETGSLILTMDRIDLISFIRALRRGEAAEFDLSPPIPRPVFRPVTHLILSPVHDRPLSVSLEDDKAQMVGGKVSLSLFADELSEFDRENDLYEPGMHAHFDPSEKQSNGLEIAVDSVELIVTGPVPDD